MHWWACDDPDDQVLGILLMAVVPDDWGGGLRDRQHLEPAVRPDAAFRTGAGAKVVRSPASQPERRRYLAAGPVPAPRQAPVTPALPLRITKQGPCRHAVRCPRAPALPPPIPPCWPPFLPQGGRRSVDRLTLGLPEPVPKVSGLFCRRFMVPSRSALQISDPAPLIFDCQPEHHRRVHCIWFVRLSVHALTLFFCPK